MLFFQVQKLSINKEETKLLYESVGKLYQVELKKFYAGFCPF